MGQHVAFYPYLQRFVWSQWSVGICPLKFLPKLNLFYTYGTKIIHATTDWKLGTFFKSLSKLLLTFYPDMYKYIHRLFNVSFLRISVYECLTLDFFHCFLKLFNTFFLVSIFSFLPAVLLTNILNMSEITGLCWNILKVITSCITYYRCLVLHWTLKSIPAILQCVEVFKK